VQALQTDLRLNTPELRSTVNATNSAMSVSRSQPSASPLQTMLGGRQVTRFKKDGEQYDVIVQVAPRDRTRPNDISDIYVRARDGSMVQLANVVGVVEGVSPQSLNHFQRLRAVDDHRAARAGIHARRGACVLDETAKRVLPQDALTDMNGQSREFRDARGGFYLTWCWR